MDFDALFDRASLAGQGISIVVRSCGNPTHPTSHVETTKKLLALLTTQSRPAEILFLANSYPAEMPPARIDGTRVRYLVSSNPTSGTSLMAAVRQTRFPIVLLLDDAVSLDGKELQLVLDRLEYCDIVVGRRTKRWSWSSLAWPVDRMLRTVLGVPFKDPFCPIKIARREAVCEIHLDRDEKLADLEMLAKGTYLVRLVDEVGLALRWSGPTITRALFSQWREFVFLLVRPTFADRVDVSLPTVQGVSLAHGQWKQRPSPGTVWGSVPRQSWRSVHPIEGSHR